MFTDQAVRYRFILGSVVIFQQLCLFGCSEPPAPAVKKQGSSPVKEQATCSVQALVDQLDTADFNAKLDVMDEIGKLEVAAKAAVPILIRILEDDKSPIPGADAAVKQGIIARLEDANPTLRSSAAAILGDIGPAAKPAIPALLKNLKDENKCVRSVSADALAAIGSKEERVLAALTEALNDSLSEVKIDVAQSLDELDPDNPDALSTLLKLLKDKDPETRRDAASVLTQIQSTKIHTIVSALLAALKDPDEIVRGKAAVCLGSICEDSKTVVPALVESLAKDKSSRVRVQAAQALREYGPEAKSAIPDLTRATKEDPDVRVQKSAAESIKRISTMPAKRGKMKAKEEVEQMIKDHPELKKDLKRRRGERFR